MKPRHIYLDLDRTLIDTPALIQALFMACQAEYDIAATTLRTEMPDYCPVIGEQYYYDFFEHLAAHGIERQQLEEDMLASLADIDFIYPDAHAMLQFLTTESYTLSILSFGKHDFQQLKHKLAPQLKKLPLTTILSDKGDFLAGLNLRTVLVIDDKLIKKLPTHAQEFWLDRQAPQPVEQRDRQYVRIRDLHAVADLLRPGYNEAD